MDSDDDRAGSTEWKFFTNGSLSSERDYSPMMAQQGPAAVNLSCRWLHSGTSRCSCSPGTRKSPPPPRGRHVGTRGGLRRAPNSACDRVRDRAIQYGRSRDRDREGKRGRHGAVPTVIVIINRGRVLRVRDGAQADGNATNGSGVTELHRFIVPRAYRSRSSRSMPRSTPVVISPTPRPRFARVCKTRETSDASCSARSCRYFAASDSRPPLDSSFDLFRHLKTPLLH